MIKRLRLKKLLSFLDTEVELRQLNVLIGANGVGKSNLIEAVGLLQGATVNLENAIRAGGGVRQWLWMGNQARSSNAVLECELTSPAHLVYSLEFSDDQGGLVIASETLRNSTGYFSRSPTQVAFEHASEPTGITRNQSVLSFRVLGAPAPISELAAQLQQIRIYRNFKTIGTGAFARYGTSAASVTDALMDEADNLALVIHELDFRGLHNRVLEFLHRFGERFQDVKMRVDNGIARLFLKETDLAENVPAVRMSDGTLKFLCLLAVLLHPNKPPLICIEEPELGLHPDAMQIVADALIEASASTQLIVTTHSEALVDALSDRPDSVLVCERDFDNGTQFKRLSKDELGRWLERYTLGQLWRKGEIGGSRW